MAGTIIIVPCFNEAERLSIEAFHGFAKQWHEGSFLFVDDGSTDATFTILTELQELAPSHFKVLRLPRNSGKAEAVRQGMLLAFQAEPEYVGFWDADLATPLHVLPLLARVFVERPTTEVVLGARVKLLGRDIQRRRLRHVLGRAFATAVAVVTGIEVYDSQCGAKLFRCTETVRDAFQAPFLSRWVFDVELLTRLLRSKDLCSRSSALRTSFYELPVPVWHDVEGSKLHLADFVRAAYDLVRIHRSMK